MEDALSTLGVFPVGYSGLVL